MQAIRSKSPILLFALILLLALPIAAAAEPEVLKSDDWRYRALAELATHSVLDEKDAPYYLTKIPINLDFAVASVERALIKLGLKDIDFTNAASLDLSLYGTSVQKLVPRDSWLLNDLTKEFATQLATRGLVGKASPVQAQVGDTTAALPVSDVQASPEPPAAQQGPVVLSLTDVLKKINMPSALSQSSLTMKPQDNTIPQVATGMEPLQVGSINPDTSKVVSLFDVLNVNASLFADDSTVNGKSSAGIGLKLGDDQGGGLTLDYKMVGGKDEASNLTDLSAITGVGVKYQVNSIMPFKSVTDSITIQAGYNIESGDLKAAVDNGIELQASASLGIYYKLLLGNAAFLQAGYQVEQVRNLIASGALSTKSWMYDDSSPLGWIFRGSLSLNSDVGVKQLAGIDVGYNLFKDASIMIGYRLIDFSDFDKLDLKKNLTALGISIKF